jgi:protein TonB
LAIDLVQPSYPAIAKQAHVSGTVKIQVLIDESGDVIAAQAIDGNPLLQPAAVAAARASKFRPVKICDKPVKVNGIVAYNFVSP